MGLIDIDQVGHPKVGQHDMGTNHQNIGWLYIPMEDALRPVSIVGIIQRVGSLFDDR
jgi:hypothetical protein